MKVINIWVHIPGIIIFQVIQLFLLNDHIRNGATTAQKPFWNTDFTKLVFQKAKYYLTTKHSSESYHITAKSGLSVGTVDFLILRVIRFASNCENMKTQIFLSWFHLDYICLKN